MSVQRLILSLPMLCAVAFAQTHVPHRVLVRFAPGTPAAAQEQAVATACSQFVSEIPKIGVKVLSVSPLLDDGQSLNVLRRNPNIEFAEYDEIVADSQVAPNDPLYSDSQPQLKKINAPNAWDKTVGDPNLTVAVIDSGIDSSHPDISAKIVPGWNFYDNNSNTNDVYGHGTKVAGTIGAIANNATGVASVAWNVRLMPLRVTDVNGYGSISGIANALVFAADHGARVANASFATLESSSTVASAADYFYNKGGVFTIAAGNNSVTFTMPDNPEIVDVSAIDSNDVIYSWSCRGTVIDVCAPGQAYTTTMGGGYGLFTGTSAAAPTAAGVAALILSENSSLSAKQVIDIMESQARDLGSAGWDGYYGYGCVDAGRSVAAAQGSTSTADTTAPTASFTSPANGATISGIQTIEVSASDNDALAFVNLYVDGAPFGTTGQVTTSWSLDTAALADGNHTLAVVAADVSGNTTTVQIAVSVQNAVDTQAPTVSITSPTGGAIKGNLTVSVSAQDNVGVNRVELYVDGRYVTTATSAPFTTSANTKKIGSGTHSVQCRAYDQAGNIGSSQVVTVSFR